jgi:GTP-binding protein LepA
MPLSEMVYNFYDKLKAKSKGYASFDYKIIGYRKSNITRVDILINKEKVDALSFIVPEDDLYRRAKEVVEKLKDSIPKHLFEIPIQAFANNRVIARSTVKALRKDVLAKCYGGDVTRKMKLLEKQKQGKKKMKQLGKVNLPQEVFLSVLRIGRE